MGKKLDGYTLTEKLRKARRRHHLSAPTQALYYELVAICNEEDWVDEFKCSNDELCSALKVSENSLIDYRQHLIQAGLILYKSGKSKKQIGTYSFNYLKICSQSDNQKGNQSGSPMDNPMDNQKGEKGSDSIIDKLKPNLNQTKTKIISSGDKPPVKKKGPEKKATAVLYWKKLVDDWFGFYETHFQIKPTFDGASAKALKNILSQLEKRTKEKSFEWTSEHATTCFLKFLEMAKKDNWIAANFMLPVLNQKFDKIVNPIQHAPGSNFNKQPTGGNIDTRTAFDKIDILTAANGGS